MYDGALEKTKRFRLQSNAILHKVWTPLLRLLLVVKRQAADVAGKGRKKNN